MMYSAYKLNKQGDKYSLDALFFLFGTSLLLHVTQVSQEAGQMVWYSHLFQNFPQFVVIHTVKVFGIVNKDVFLELSCFFDDPTDVSLLRNLYAGQEATVGTGPGTD